MKSRKGQRRLTRQGFRLWLLTQSFKNVVGTTNNSDCCPIAFYLNRTTGQLHEVMDKDYTIYPDGNDGVSCKLPKWAREFVKKVDKLSNGHIPVQAWQAVNILNECD